MLDTEGFLSVFICIRLQAIVILFAVR